MKKWIIGLLLTFYFIPNAFAYFSFDKTQDRLKIIDQELDRTEQNFAKDRRSQQIPTRFQSDNEPPQNVFTPPPSYSNKVLKSEQILKTVEPKKEPRIFKSNIGMNFGFRRDDIDWNIASDITGTATPNIISELTWSDLQIAQLKLIGDITLMDSFVLDGSFAYGFIYEGENQDSDYLGNNRTLEFSRSNNQTDNDDTIDISGGLGYKLGLGSDDKFFMADNMELTFLGGYSYHEQNLRITDGFQSIPATGSFPGLNSTYETEWMGPWFGVTLAGEKEKFRGSFRFEYHLADYYGEANWNLRNDFAHPKSFEHESDGSGLVFNFGADYLMSKNWSLDFDADFQDWKADGGITRFFLSDGTSAEQKLNQVNWNSMAFMLGATYHFE